MRALCFLEENSGGQEECDDCHDDENCVFDFSVDLKMIVAREDDAEDEANRYPAEGEASKIERMSKFEPETGEDDVED